jgi:hypothetical protein
MTHNATRRSEPKKGKNWGRVYLLIIIESSLETPFRRLGQRREGTSVAWEVLFHVVLRSSVAQMIQLKREIHS